VKRHRVVVVAVVLSSCLVVGTTSASATTPDTNGRVAFSMDLGLGGEIYTIRPNGLGIQQLTEVHGEAESPDWSPDGAIIAFHIVDRGIWEVNADGSGLHRVVTSGFQPAFTPDGTHLVYDCGDCAGGQGIFLVAADGSDAPGVRLTTNPSGFEGDTNPEVSPDGGTVTFVRKKVEGKPGAVRRQHRRHRHSRAGALPVQRLHQARLGA
jgi:Tol biopolymer transport system component